MITPSNRISIYPVTRTAADIINGRAAPNAAEVVIVGDPAQCAEIFALVRGALETWPGFLRVDMIGTTSAIGFRVTSPPEVVDPVLAVFIVIRELRSLKGIAWRPVIDGIIGAAGVW